MSVSLKDIIQELEIKNVLNEELYKINQLMEKLRIMEIEFFKADEYIITPYYFADGKIYELYVYELNVRIVKEKNFEEYVKKKTGKNRIEDIPNEIIELHKNCCIEITDIEGLSKKSILDYISYLQSFEQIKHEIVKMFSAFDTANLYFVVY